jgi:hypothetical protein
MDKPLWTFRGYTTDAGNRLVQEWFHERLSIDDRDLIRDRIRHLKEIERHLWIRPGFDKLDDDLNEIRIKTPAGPIRIYGYFPPGERHCFTLLHGLYKTANNDKAGKRVARERLKLLKQGIGDTHEFDFEERTSSEDSSGQEDQGSTGSIKSLGRYRFPN